MELFTGALVVDLNFDCVLMNTVIRARVNSNIETGSL